MKTTLAIAALTLATLTGPARAQPAPESAITAARTRNVTADPLVAIPIGDAADFTGLGIGASATLNVPVNPLVDVTGRLGLIYHLPKNDVQVTLVPIYGGVRYRLSPAPSSLYGAAELGLTWGRGRVDTGVGTASDTDTELGGTLGLGYVTPRLDLRAALLFPDAGNIDDALAIMASASFRVADL